MKIFKSAEQGGAFYYMYIVCFSAAWPAEIPKLRGKNFSFCALFLTI
jgi:hypothetical protein